MGKRRQNLSGLSAFAKELLKEQVSLQPVAASESPHAVETPRPINSLGPKLARRATDQPDTEGRDRKKRKVGLLGPNNEKFDATGLVPYYTDASEVPEHLSKCTFPTASWKTGIMPDFDVTRFLPKRTLLLSLFLRLSFG